MTDYPRLKFGDTGEAVKAAQQLLGIAMSGTFDAAMRTRVQEVQVANGLEADGIVGPYTWRALLQAQPTPVPVPPPPISTQPPPAQPPAAVPKLSDFDPATQAIVAGFVDLIVKYRAATLAQAYLPAVIPAQASTPKAAPAPSTGLGEVLSRPTVQVGAGIGFGTLVGQLSGLLTDPNVIPWLYTAAAGFAGGGMTGMFKGIADKAREQLTKPK